MVVVVVVVELCLLLVVVVVVEWLLRHLEAESGLLRLLRGGQPSR